MHTHRRRQPCVCRLLSSPLILLPTSVRRRCKHTHERGVAHDVASGCGPCMGPSKLGFDASLLGAVEQGGGERHCVALCPRALGALQRVGSCGELLVPLPGLFWTVSPPECQSNGSPIRRRAPELEGTHVAEQRMVLLLRPSLAAQSCLCHHTVQMCGKRSQAPHADGRGMAWFCRTR